VKGEDKPSRYSRLITASPIYYGWVVLAAGTLGMLMTTPDQTVGVSVFLAPIIADLGLPRSLVSLLYRVGTLTGSLALPWIDRFGPSRAVVAIIAIRGLDREPWDWSASTPLTSGLCSGEGWL